MSPAATDKLLDVVLALAAEVWVLRDRVTLLEQVLQEDGIDDVAARIDAYARRPERTVEVERDRDAFMHRLLRAITREPKGVPYSASERNPVGSQPVTASI